MSSAVSLHRVTLTVAGRTVLSDITIDVGTGEFIGLLGPNGAGKTSLIRAVLGLLRPAAGRLSLFGGKVRRGDPRIGYLPQTRAVPHAANLSGRTFLAASIRGNRWGVPVLSTAERDQIEASLEMVEGGTLAKRPLAAMSGGERQRLLIAGALLGAPRLLLLDEPLISLDPSHQRAVVDLVKRLADTLDLTVLFAAHEVSQLVGAVDRVLYLGGGQAAIGTVEEVIRPEVLTRLYGSPIDVIRAGEHLFVISGGRAVEHEHHHGHAHL